MTAQHLIAAQHEAELIYFFDLHILAQNNADDFLRVVLAQRVDTRAFS